MARHTEKELRLFKILDIFGMIFVAIGTFNNFMDGVDHPPFTSSLLYPYTNFLVPGTNVFTLLLTILYLFMPTQVWIIFFLFILESTHLMLTGFETVGIIMYVNFMAVISASGYAKKNFRIKAVSANLFLFLLLLPLIKTSGFFDFFYNLGFAAFMNGCYIILYFMLQDKLSFLFNDVTVPDMAPSVDLPEKGTVLDLKKLGLTDRQIACVNYTLNTSWNYKRIAEELITSESTVKKDMQDLYKLFGVKNREMLRLCLVQYTIQ